MQTTLIDQGLNLMLYGMGTVFVFLTVLVFATGAMSAMVRRLAPESDAALLRDNDKASSNDNIDEKVRAAIKLAITEHRRR
ncbi:MAG: OadG family protein [Gammaproteobacteria bacterium]|nr:OadG family protein [Gammaproteobacteria bacterium]